MIHIHETEWKKLGVWMKNEATCKREMHIAQVKSTQIYSHLNCDVVCYFAVFAIPHSVSSFPYLFLFFMLEGKSDARINTVHIRIVIKPYG